MSMLTEPDTRADIEQAIIEHRKTLARMPAHWTDRRASLHAKINDLLTAWELAS